MPSPMGTGGRARQYHVKVSGTGGGGPAPVGNLLWGPDFGEGAGSDDNTWTARAAVTMPAVDLDSTDIVRSQVTMPAVAVDSTDVVRAAVTMPALDLDSTDTVKTVTVMSAVAVDGSDNVRANVTMPAVAVDGSDNVRAALTGEVLGAPFWQSVTIASTTLTTQTSVTINKPAGVVSGDLLVAFVARTAAVAVGLPAPSGWTAITDIGSTTVSAYSFYKVAGGSEPSTYTFDFGALATGGGITGEIHHVTGQHATTPINVSNTGTVSAGGTPDPASPSVTTTSVNCLVFAYLGHDHLAASQTHTPASGHAERTDFQSSALTSNLCGAHSMTRVFASAAATGTATHDCTELAGTNAAMIRVAVAPGTLVIA